MISKMKSSKPKRRSLWVRSQLKTEVAAEREYKNQYSSDEEQGPE